MATIFYSVMGEGRGHAARARAMAEQLRHAHRVVIYTSFDALTFLREQYGRSSEVAVRETTGLKFWYTNGRIDPGKTIAKGLRFRWHLEEQVQRLIQDFERDEPDIVITDFEPTVPRAAHRIGTPVMSLDHQHFILAYDLRGLSWRLRTHAAMMAPLVRSFGIGQQKTVVSAFYFPPLRPGYEHVVQVGPLLRPLVRKMSSTVGDHLLCYLRKNTPARVVEAMSGIDRPVRIYGVGQRPPHGKLTYWPIDEVRFVEDLASCCGVIAAAGNQLAGEAMYFKKPFLAIPEKRHHEQRINASFMKQMGGGDWTFAEQLTPHHIAAFLENMGQYRENLHSSPHNFDGTPDALREIEEFLQRRSQRGNVVR